MTATSQDNTNGRDSRGRFAAGNSIARGRPRREREKEFLAAFDKALPASELTEVVTAILQRAKAGSIPAARLLIEYSIGKPIERIAFENELEYRVAGQSPAEGMESMMEYINKKVQERRAYEASLPEAFKGRNN